MYRFNRTNFRKRGLSKATSFTLIELLIATAVIVVLGVIGFLDLFKYRETQQLDSAAKEVIASLRYAQAQAISQEQSSQWGVKFAQGNNGDPDYYAIYYGASGLTGITTVTTSLPSNVRLQSGVDINFSKLTGFSPAGGTITLYLVSDPSITIAITVNAYGTISKVVSAIYNQPLFVNRPAVASAAEYFRSKCDV